MEKRRRISQTIVVWSMGLGLTFLIILLRVPCWIKALTGLDCPTCGTVRLVEYFVKGDFYGSFQQNRFMFAAIPLGIIFAVYASFLYIKTGRLLQTKIEKILLAVVLITAILFTVMRNI